MAIRRSPPALEALLDQCMLSDRPRLLRELRRLQSAERHASQLASARKKSSPRQYAEKVITDKKLPQPDITFEGGKQNVGEREAVLVGRIETSIARAIQRRASVPDITYSADLPIAEHRERIAAAIRDHQVVVISGETGSGKTTQLPKICLELGRGVHGLIGHTQPRRIAATTVATRIAEELQVAPGGVVGHQVRFQDQCGDQTLVKLMTDGILLAEIHSDSQLHRYDTLIIDEAHERSLNIDFILGYLKRLLPQRPDLKVIITSATIDVKRFAAHFDNAPVIEVSGRTYPVQLQYRPPGPEEDLPTSIVAAVAELLLLPQRGDILVFVSGERDIREAAEALRQADLRHVEVLPLYARLGLRDQRRVFQAHRGTRVILATNVAETSITVPGVRYVVDTGYARISRYSYRTKVQRLPVEAISQASANQRAGRCGRVANGVCIRLYSEQDFMQRPEFTDPEILRTNLAAVILQMLQFKIGDVRQFPFVDPPDNRFVNDGFNLLAELGAVGEREQLSDMGRQIARLPVDPKFGRMLLAATREGCLREVLVIVSALSIQDPRERPAEKRQAADEKHRKWNDPDSDFYTLWNMWSYFEIERQQLSRNQFANLCRQQSVSYTRIREWREVHHQLHMSCRQLGLRDNREPAQKANVHRALLSGLLGNIGFRHENGEYLGARNRKFYVFPGSGLFKKQPKWLMAGELLETSRLFALSCAEIQPQWLSEIAAHRIKKYYNEPHYDARSGRIMAYEKQTLYGLVIVEKNRVEFGKIDASGARAVFIQQALVEGRYAPGHGAVAPFAAHNQNAVQQLDELEERMRRRDIVADERVLFDFYDERVPAHITSLSQFEKWRRAAEKSHPELLFIDRELLVHNMPAATEVAQFPTSIDCEGLSYSLIYRFEPGHAQDGVSVKVPIAILHQVPAARFEWLVPGLLRDKVIAMLKALPKKLRRHFVPVPDYADRALSSLQPENRPLGEALSSALHRITGVSIPRDCWQPDKLDTFYRINFVLMDEDGATLEQSRDLEQLRQKYQRRVEKALNAESAVGSSLAGSGITNWNFGDLPEVIIESRDGMQIRSYPALVDAGDSVAICLRDSPLLAAHETRRGVVRLAVLQRQSAERRWRKELCRGRELAFAAANLPDLASLVVDMVAAAYRQACFDDRPLPRSQQEFNQYLERGAVQVGPVALELERLLNAQAQALAELYTVLQVREASYPRQVAVCREQLAKLFAPGFLAETSFFWLRQFERYVLAATARFDKLPQRETRDRQIEEDIAGFAQAAQELGINTERLPLATQLEIERLRFMVEEYRVSVYAQSLKTAVPVSIKRLQAQRDLAAHMVAE